MSVASWPASFPASQSVTGLFSYEVKGPRRTGAFSFALLLQSCLVVLLGLLSLTPSVIETTHHYNVTTLIAPPAEHVVESATAVPVSAPKPVPQVQPPVPVPAPEPVRDIPPATVPEHIAAIPTPKVPVGPPAPAPVAFDTAPARPMPVPTAERHVETNVFGSSASPTLSARAVATVQTGGFGDRNGVPASNSTHAAHATIATSGGFDLPSGPGYGNGAGGAHGARRTVASAGFGNGVATATPTNSRGRLGEVQQTQFSPPPVAANTTPTKKVVQPVHLAPVRIQSKPAPVYTAEARELRIEGEVIVNVVFTAAGEIRIIGVLKGLGHGLDEAAVVAARKIRFIPAQQDGQKVDYPATLHIVFALS